jgi:hypothetical protein
MMLFFFLLIILMDITDRIQLLWYIAKLNTRTSIAITLSLAASAVAGGEHK